MALKKVKLNDNIENDVDIIIPSRNLNELLSIEGMSQGGSESSTVDNLFAVGDIKTTMRDSLGEKWLECNGDMLDKNDYEDLYNSNTAFFLNLIPELDTHHFELNKKSTTEQSLPL